MPTQIPQRVIEELKEIEQIKDNLGLPIDNKIKLLIATLRSLDFVTVSSCGGHEDRGPYVDISSKIAQQFEENPEVQEIIDAMISCPNEIKYQNEYIKLNAKPKCVNLSEAFRLFVYLKSFYKNRFVDLDYKITIESIGGGLGGYRIFPQGNMFIRFLNTEQKKRYLKNAQKEMSDFAEFLYSK